MLTKKIMLTERFYDVIIESTSQPNGQIMNNGKIIPNINKIITPIVNNNINTNLKSAKKEKEINNEANNNINIIAIIISMKFLLLERWACFTEKYSTKINACPFKYIF